jgi:hypothetical protein
MMPVPVRTISERFTRDDVEVSLEWIPENSLYTYHVDVNQLALSE